MTRIQAFYQAATKKRRFFRSKEHTFVWLSSRESIKQGTVSALAVLEIPIAFCLFWWIALEFSQPLMTLLAFFAVPFLLLRSPQSIAMGLSMLRSLAGSKNTERLFHTASGIATIVMFYFVLTDWSVFIVSLITVSSLILFVVFGARYILKKSNLFRPIFELIVAPFAIATYVGLFSCCVCIRAHVTVRHLFSGLYFYSDNWRETVLCSDTAHLPELMPNAHTIDIGFTAHGLAIYRNEKSVSIEWITRTFALIVCIPAWAYRLNIKASFWLWGALAMLLPRFPIRHLKERERIQAATISRGHWHKPRWALVLVIPAYLLAGLLPNIAKVFEADFISKLVAVIRDYAPPPTYSSARFWFLLCLWALIWRLVWASDNFYAAYNKPAGSAADALAHVKTNPEVKRLYRQKLRHLLSVNRWVFGTFILTAAVFALQTVSQKWPTLLGWWSWISPWL